MTSELLVGIGEAAMTSAHPASAFSATQASPLTGAQPDAPSTGTGAFSPTEDPGPFPSTLGGPVPNDTATVTAETSTFPPTATFAATSAFPTSTMQLSPEAAQPEAPAAQPSGPDSRFFSPPTGGTRVKHNPPGYARAPSPAPDALQDPPEAAAPASAPPAGPTISAAAAPDDALEDGIEEPGFESEDGEIPLPEGTVPPALLAENTNRLTSVTPNPAITQLITAHFLGGAAGPLVLGFMTGSLSGFGFLWYLLAVLLVLAGALYLMPKHHRGV